MRAICGSSEEPAGDAAPGEAAAPARRRRIPPSAWAMLALALMTLGVFAPELLRGGRVVLGEIDHDMWMYFLWVRGWAYQQMAAGNFPLWNPHIYCGMPFFGTFLSALLYPPNLLFFIMPTAAAMNWTFALHVFLAGAFTYAWCRTRGISHLGGLLAGVIFMFCGGHFFKVGCGWPNLSHAIAWIPLVLLCVDQLFKTGRLAWALPGAAAVSMQVLCGGPQYAYSTGLVAGIYILLTLPNNRQHWRKVLAGTALMYGVAGALCAFQVVAAMDLARESIRSGGMDEAAATAGSFPLSAYLTLLNPYVYGTRSTPVAEGAVRWLMLNVGVVGLILAVYGVVRGGKQTRRWSLALMVVIICLLAMGKYSPLHNFVYHYVPGYKYFRAMSRFTALASVFLAVLAAVGFDALRDPQGRPGRFAILPACAGLLLAAAAAWIYATRLQPDGGAWGMMLQWLDWSGQMYGRFMMPDATGQPGGRSAFTALMLLLSGGVFLAASALLLGAQRYRWASHVLLGIAVVEMLITARASVVSLKVPYKQPNPGWAKAMAATRGEQRTWQTIFTCTNWSMGTNTLEANGYEPAMLRRFGLFFPHVSDGKPIEQAWYDPAARAAITRYPAIAEMLRIKRFLVWDRPWVKAAERAPMPRLALVHECRVETSIDDIFNTLRSPDFQPRQLVMLENEPAIRPQQLGKDEQPGTVRIVKDSIDEIEIVAQTSKPAILLMTDAYSEGWHAVARKRSDQKQYQIMPANWLLRGIPLSAGKHHLLLRYRPKYHTAGLGISILALVGCVLAAGWIGISAWRAWRRTG